MVVTRRIHGRHVVSVLLLLAAVAALPARHSSAAPLTVMSENIYMGADPLLAWGCYVTAGRWAAVVPMTQFWNDVQATNFNERAESIANQIVANKPALVGLQEVMQYWTGPADSLTTVSWYPQAKADHLELDFLQILLARLAAKGLPYMAVAVTTEGEYELAGVVGGALKDIRMVDRVAIIARKDLLKSAMQISNPQGGPFVTNLPVVTSSGEWLTLQRAWNSVDVTWGGKKFRFINMCLETPAAPWTQAVQAWELLIGPAATTLPVVLVGDSNSNGIPGGTNTLSYDLLLGWGAMKDVWTQINPADPGATWGNDPNLKNPNPLTYQILGLGGYRMDLVLYRGAFQANAAKRVGVLASERTITGMWPSDHAGVVATIDVK